MREKKLTMPLESLIHITAKRDTDMSYITQLTDYDEEHIFMPIPEELLKELSWKEDDKVVVKIDKESGTVTIQSKKDSESDSNAT